MKKLLIIISLLFFSAIYGQEIPLETNTHKGELSFGVRTTESLFSESGNYFGIGAGWQVRYRVSNSFNTEWFADWVTTDVGGIGQRYDAHIGESMMIYPGKTIGKKHHFTPYILGGFCGDYTKIQTNIYFDDNEKSYVENYKERWSFASQLGIGTHYNLTDNFDISLSTQYVLHFGKDIHTDTETNSLGEEYLHIHDKNEGSLEGHLFITLSLSFVLVDFLKSK